MHPAIRSRLKFIIIFLLFIATGTGIILYALTDNIVFFYTPSELKSKKNISDIIRIGGVVKPGSILLLEKSNINFIVTDNKDEIEIHYKGPLPPLFRDGQGVVAKGLLDGKKFIATELLTKHDETYKPK